VADHRSEIGWLVVSLVFGSVLAPAVAAPPGASLAAAPSVLSQDLAGAVSETEQEATIRRLVAFGTRHTMSDTTSTTRGIGAARRWVEARLTAIGADCGCFEVVTPSATVTGERIPQPTEIVDVVAIQRGTGDPGRVVLITGHLDSRVTDVMNATSDAPGADDDGSGTAAVIEAARVLSRHRFAATIVYGVLSGEEQGLYGGKVLADFAKARGWQVEGDLNNDIIGNSHGSDGVHDSSLVRVFSEGVKAVETPAQAQRRRSTGGEVDSPSRNLARYVAAIAERELANLRVETIYRTDRFRRGGDQIPFLEAGYPAIRFTEAHEDYRHQHQDVRTEGGIAYGDTIEGVDFPYLAQVTRLNTIALAQLAAAPAPPGGVAIDGAVTPDTTVSWNRVAGAVSYRVWRRRTTDPQWRIVRDVVLPAGADPKLTLREVAIDDWFFGVSAVSAEGFESPIVFPGEGGSFW
jgi:Zn-dependent M28 family amino/carboxypeptidase